MPLMHNYVQINNLLLAVTVEISKSNLWQKRENYWNCTGNMNILLVYLIIIQVRNQEKILK